MDFPDCITPFYEYKVRQYKQMPCHTNRASSLGGDCPRCLVYDRLRWKDALPPSRDLMVIFQEGEKHEAAVLDDLRRAGLKIIEQQVSLEWKDFEITGHVDAILVVDGEVVPLDIKSMSPHIWDSIFRRGPGAYPWQEVKDGFQSKPWLRKYLGQIMLYCLMKGVERGILLAINKGTGALAQVNIEVDYEYGESLLQRARTINEHVKAGTLPDRIPFAEDVCPKCSYYHLCLPEQFSSGKPPIAFLELPEVEALLAVRDEGKERAAQYDEADSRVKAWAKAQDWESAQVGRWLVRKKVQKNGTRVDVTNISGSPA